jgi:GT2 family glycosyltransferase
VIVVDHGSTDGTRAGLRDEFPQVLRIPGNTAMWWTAATNLGIREALQRGATDIMLLNNDCYVDYETVARLKRHQIDAGEAVIAPVQRSLESGKILTRRTATCFLLGFPTLLLPGRTLYRPQEHRLLSTPLIMGGRGVLIPISVLDKTGLLNETDLPRYGSDHDFFLRCRRLGIPLFIASDAVVDVESTSTTLATQYGKMSFQRFLATLRERRSHRNLRELTALFRLHYPIPGLYPLGVALNLLRYTVVYGTARILHLCGLK